MTAHAPSPTRPRLKVPGPLRHLLSRLPMQPPSAALALVLQQRWWPLVDPSSRQALMGKVVEVVVDDLGLSCRLVADRGGLRAAGPHECPAVRLKADASTYWRLILAQDDPDTLFFERRLVMEGDTEVGLMLKNTLDAVGPVDLWPHRPPQRRHVTPRPSA